MRRKWGVFLDVYKENEVFIKKGRKVTDTNLQILVGASRMCILVFVNSMGSVNYRENFKRNSKIKNHKLLNPRCFISLPY